jgi:phage N-6-adenine-methyltransferase
MTDTEAQPVAKLAYYDEACRALAKARSVDEVSQLRNVADGMRAYARQAKNKRLEIEATEIRFRAERRLGLLMSAQKATVGLSTGGRPRKTGVITTPVLPALAEAGIDKNLAKLARKYAEVPEEKFESILAERRATIEAANAKVTVDLLGGSKLRGTQGTGENEWYTPADIIHDARAVLGVIDLDPASSEQAQRNVRALQYFTLADDGLKRMWHGNVWLNPPHAQPHIEDFADKMIAEIEAGRVASAIMLTHNYTDTAWFQKLATKANAVCFPKGRIRFEAPDGTLASPTQGQAFFYFGKDVPKFSEVFAPLGFVT